MMRTGLLLIPREFHTLYFDHMHANFFPNPFQISHLLSQPPIYVFSPSSCLSSQLLLPIYNLSTTVWAARILLATGSYPEVWLTYQELPRYKRIGSPSPRTHHMSLASQLGVGAHGALPTLHAIVV